MYLTEDIIGASTRKVYGVKGDKIEVVKNEPPNLILVQGSSERFHVHPYQLSEEKVEKVPVEAVKPKKKK